MQLYRLPWPHGHRRRIHRPPQHRCAEQDNVLSLSINELTFKEMFLKPNINVFETLFEKLPELFNCNINELKKYINNTFDNYKIKLDNFYLQNINELKSKLVISDSLKSSYDLWKNSYNSYISNIVFSDENKKIYNSFEMLKFNDKDAINLLSNAIFNSTLEDWNIKKKDTFFMKIDDFIKTISNYDINKSISKKSIGSFDSEYQLSTLGKTLYSNLKDSIDEYGSSISNEEKAQVIKKILNDILN